MIISHRANNHKFVENTKQAIENIIEHNIKAIEFDIHLTKDNILVIHHDETLNRIYGINQYIKDLTFNKIKTIINDKNKELISLECFIDNYAQSFDLINIELKTNLINYPNIEDVLYQLLTKNGEIDYQKFILSSFNQITLNRLYLIDQKLILGYLIDKLPFDKKTAQICRFLNVKYQLLNNKILMHHNLIIWNINNINEINKLNLCKNVKHIITDVSIEISPSF